MKKILAPVLPALALLTLGGCASTSYLSTTEDDGMYYSSKDRVTVPAQVASSGSSAAPATAEQETTAAPGDVANPDYAGTAGRAATTSEEYYDDDYYYASRLRRFHSPYRGIGMGYYDFAYTDPFWYGGPALGYSPWGYGYNSFYDPFYSPWGYGGVNISIGFGRPWGWGRPWGGYGYGYGYRPFDYGWGGPWGGYNYGYLNGYYTGLYGGGGYYGGNGWSNYYDRPGRRVTYGPRRDRAVEGQRLGSAAPDGVVSGRSRGRVQEGGFTTPTPDPSGVVAQPNAGGGRRRVQELTETTTVPSTQPTAPAGRMRVVGDQPIRNEELSTATDPTVPTGGSRRWRVVDNPGNVEVTSPNGGSPQPVPAEYGRRRRADWNTGGSTQPQPEQPRLADQPRRQRLYDQSSQPSQPTRTYSEPSRTYSEPARTYSQPSRSYSEPSRSYSEPSRGSSNYGGSNAGGSGGGGRRGRVQ
ncbi:hypothetical protein [Hymenobacter sp. 102]|uniref:hypothetical protein n=1 Tax=Hymenobacter sp. 102 TaxID=3403152 RepID=UPI003CEB1AD9